VEASATMAKKGWEPQALDKNEKASGLPSKSWLANGLELLFERKGLNKHGKPFDVVIVGSGYGGSIAANELSKAVNLGLSVCLLERGREFLPGSFPNSIEEAPTELRYSPKSGSKPNGNLEGLIDIRLGKDLNIVQANGLGGGSLINAGVMARAEDTVFEHASWPREITAESISNYYDEMEILLGAVNKNDDGSVTANTITSHQEFSGSHIGPQKYESLKRLAHGAIDNKKASKQAKPASFKSASITVNMRDQGKTVAGVPLSPCNLCGDCASGCNNNSKISLDKNLLVLAARQGVEIFTGASVLDVEALSTEDPANGEAEVSARWKLNVVFTDAQLRSRQSQKTLEVKTRNIILSAGALGSTEILQRSSRKGLDISNSLGSRFSSNGDMLAVGFDQNQASNAIANAKIEHSKRRIGPTITGMIDLRDSVENIVIQEMSVPAAASHLFTEMFASVNSLRGIWNSDKTAHITGNNFADPAAINKRAMRHTSLYAIMGNDDANGKLDLDPSSESEGTIQVNWSELKNHELFKLQVRKLKALAGKARKGLGGTILPNPIWRLLNPHHMNVLNLENGPPLSVHPLGGCPMADSPKDGVTDHLGRVYTTNASESRTHPGLIVLDGSIIPTAVGINPALTISAVALRAIRTLITKQLISGGLSVGAKTISASVKTERVVQPPISEVPVIRDQQELTRLANQTEVDTQIQITERLIGKTQLENNEGELEDVTLELTLWSKPVDIKSLSKSDSPISNPSVEIDGTRQNPVVKQPLSKLRIYRKDVWRAIRAGQIEVDKHEVALDHAATFVGRIEGRLTLFGRGESYPLSRRIEGFSAWRKNRGWRDIYQHKRPREWEPTSPKASRCFFTHLNEMLTTLSRAGEIRTLNYDLSVAQVLKSDDFSYFGPELQLDSSDLKKLTGRKFLHYTRRSNPWIQLSEVQLDSLPEPIRRSKTLSKKVFSKLPFLKTILSIGESTEPHNEKQRKMSRRKGNSLYLDTNYLTKIGVPLIQVSKQENQVKALSEISSFSAYLARMLVAIHFYSFRAPDNPRPRQANRRAKAIPGLPIPQPRVRISVDHIPDNTISGLNQGDDVSIELLHFRHHSPSKPPILMIHGYSASSTSFAHHSVPNGLAQYFYNDARDIWLVDLRTSSALRSARYPWKFESVADTDIPIAISHIYDHYQQTQKIDIITHCMGSLMLGMSILNPDELEDDFFKRRINRIVFSQATPTISFSSNNNLRSFATKYLKELVPDNYQFQIDSHSLLSSKDNNAKNKSPNTILDRLLYTLPYPNREFDLTNPTSLPWRRREFARTRHRMDAFFSRTFELGNMSKKTLHCIDDFFGPIHVDTIIQASRFADNNVVTDVKGFNAYVSKESLQRYWADIPTMSFHSVNNGLVDFSTGERTQRIFKEAGVHYETVLIENPKYGHQDAIIGPSAHRDIFPHISSFLDKDDLDQQRTPPEFDQQWVIENPKHGPILIEPTINRDQHGEPEQLKVMLGGNPARACRPLILFIPVVRVADTLDVAGDSAEIKAQNLSRYVSESLLLQPSIVSSPITHWCVAEVPRKLVFEPLSDTSKVEGLACFLVYDDLTQLCPKSIVSQDHAQYKSSVEQQLSNSISNLPVSAEKLESEVLNFLNSASNNYYELSDSIIEHHNLELNDTKAMISKSLSFVFGSCQYPAGIVDKSIAYGSYQQLNEVLESKQSPKPDFIALLGDQIYADATAGFLDPSAKFDKFVQPYYRLYENTHVRSVLRKIPLYAMLDDHEICDNWEPLANPKINAERHAVLDRELSSGVKSFLLYQRGEVRSEANWNPKHENLWYQFTQKGYEFFVCDTRTERSPRTAENILHPTTTILGNEQELALEQWLRQKSNKRVKFVLSSSMLLPRHKVAHASENSHSNAIRSDSWGGYPVSLYKLLAQLVDKQLDNIVFLSGDEHIACYADINIVNLDTGKQINASSIHCPGLYTPLPFANGRIDDFEGVLDANQRRKRSSFQFEHKNMLYETRIDARFDLTDLTQTQDGMQLGNVSIKRIAGFVQISVE